MRATVEAGWSQTTPANNAAVVVTVPFNTATVASPIGQQTTTPATMGRVVGRIFNDLDADGVRDANETGIAAAQVFIDTNDDGQVSGDRIAATDANGFYYFADLAPGTYRVRQMTTSLQTTPAPSAALLVVVAADKTTTAPDFGQHAGVVTGTINGAVFNDNNRDGVFDISTETYAAQGIVVYLDSNNNGQRDANEATRKTQLRGRYSFYGLPFGTYKVRVDWPEHMLLTGPSPDGAAVVTLASSQTQAPDLGTFRLITNYATVMGQVFKDDDADGVVDAGETTFANQLVFDDTNGNGVADWNEPRALTDDTGTYDLRVFNPEATTNYTIRLATAPAGLLPLDPATGAAHQVTLPLSDIALGRNFTFKSPPPPTPTPQTLQAETATLSGGTVKATNHAGYTGTGFADYAGNGSAVQWSLTWVAAGQAKLEFRYANGSTGNRPLTVQVNGVNAGTIACAPTGGWTKWNTVSLTITLKAGQNTIKAIAGAASGANVDSLTVSPTTVVPPPPPPTGSTGKISGYAFNDSDKDGVLDSKESKASGKTVFLDTNNNGKLDSGEKSMVTDSSGNFSFTGLAAGTYAVRRVFPTGYTYSTPLRNITLTAGQVVSGVTIGSKTV